MKIGCCTNMLPKTDSNTGYEYAGLIREAGFDYLELPIGQVNELSASAFEEMRSYLRACALPVYACNNFFPASIQLVGPQVDRGHVRAFYQSALERAAQLQCRCVVLGSPWSKSCPEGFSPQAAFQQLAQWCREIGDEAQKRGIVIAIEPNNRQETNMINTFAQAVALAKAADHPSVGCLQDYYHWRMEDDTTDSLLEYGGDYLVHSHFARREARGFPQNPDLHDEIYFSALKQIGYDGAVSLEGVPASVERFPEEAAAACQFLKQMVLK
ncbi:sugar phosphate isomerase/epimerase [Pseudoflavonifractor sp. 60]|uniref:sugar phosphate isomerase/epimerase family protein n=1 Tax=Pseudoflavonifractor sp. 60 TaxID=2304576 RepID=UPI00136B35BA|nr:sugar phosphate isomerase/epimerase family protein [Pseudoflavonifractor sp. 60]NBI66372.1 sugar phosphate isomerase/epimerase [Pseudoflavonifractor sp. 60]